MSRRTAMNINTSQWHSVPLKELVEIISGEWGEESKDGSGVFVIRTTNFTNCGEINYSDVVRRTLDPKVLEKKRLKPGDIILEKSGGTKTHPVGRVVYFDRKDGTYLCNNFTQVLRPDTKQISPRFLFNALMALYAKRVTTTMFNKTTGIQNLKMKLYLGLEIPVPSIVDQRRIANQFDRIFELNRNVFERLSLLDQIVRSKFVEVFGDPVLNDKGWPTSGLLEIGECKNGMNFSPKDSGYSLRCVGVGDFKDKVTLDDLERIATINVNARPKDDLILKDGDILFVRSNGNKALVGRSLLVHPGSNEVTFSGFCIRYRISSKAFLPEFAIHYLKHDAVRKALRGRGANIQNLSQKTIQTIQAILPPLPLQRKFAKFVVEVEKLKANLRETAATLDQIYRAKQQEYFG